MTSPRKPRPSPPLAAWHLLEDFASGDVAGGGHVGFGDLGDDVEPAAVMESGVAKLGAEIIAVYLPFVRFGFERKADLVKTFEDTQPRDAHKVVLQIQLADQERNDAV